jgi:hypothetical protein
VRALITRYSDIAVATSRPLLRRGKPRQARGRARLRYLTPTAGYAVERRQEGSIESMPVRAKAILNARRPAIMTPLLEDTGSGSQHPAVMMSDRSQGLGTSMSAGGLYSASRFPDIFTG